MNDDSHFLRSLSVEMRSQGRDYYGDRCHEIADEIERLRAGIQDYLDGGCERLGIVNKVDKCPHGQFGWEACEGCTDSYFTKLLQGDKP